MGSCVETDLFGNTLHAPSWSNLAACYRTDSLIQCLQDLETSSQSTDETALFATLVNMSSSKQQPYHRWVRYREGYAGELVKEILRRYPVSESHGYVLDPMCGSGSTLVACREDNVNCAGIDVNPYAVLCTKVKTASLSAKELIKAENMLETLLRTRSLPAPQFIPIKKLDSYFPEHNFSVLCSINTWVSAIEDKNIHDLFFLALLASLEDCSNRKKDGNGLATRTCPVDDPLSRFHSQCSLMLTDIKHHPYRHGPDCKALIGSAKNMHAVFSHAVQTPNARCESIIFSPPYANSFDYYESYKLELLFGQYFNWQSLIEARKELIRNYRIGFGTQLESHIPIVKKLCDEIRHQIPLKESRTGVADGRTRLVPNMLCAYFEDMERVMAQGYHLLAPGGLMHIVVDQSAYVGVPIPTDLVFVDTAKRLGFHIESLIKCRRANTSGQQLKAYPYLKQLLRESIVSIRKPE